VGEMIENQRVQPWLRCYAPQFKKNRNLDLEAVII